ncbi:hypothetical protein P8C59_001465 [Phyllachora maydis]|uniref:AAA+ ATPase domain-containing protein n=1 Tax=Phyllachora maydis TaxID=1825666 RepID=A0AAD9M7W7_9PEZI|nr:hypothetical protein P8C59_001465 [Phyllachora maydis]
MSAMKTLEFRIRKLHTTNETEKRLAKRQPSRVYVHEEALIELTGSKDGGRPVSVEKVAGGRGDASSPSQQREATLWRAPEKLDKSVTLMYDAFRDACGYRLGESVRISPLPGAAIPDAKEVVVVAEAPAQVPAVEPLSAAEAPCWAFNVGLWLNKHVEHVYPGLTVKIVFGDPERSFRVSLVNGQANANARYKHNSTSIRLSQPESESTDSAETNRKLEVSGVRGIDSQVSEINDMLSIFNEGPAMEDLLLPCGLVIHGGNGTGKTMLLDNIAKSGWGTVHRIQHRDKVSEIQDTFQRAQAQQPSIVLVDQLDRLIDKERSNRPTVILTICEAFEALERECLATRQLPRVAIIATCVDATQLPRELQKGGRFEEEVYLPLPDVGTREVILASLSPRLRFTEDGRELLSSLSSRTHAYTGDDLQRLFRKAVRTQRRQTSLERAQDGETTVPPPMPTSSYGWNSALAKIRPSAMHDINLKPPPVRWSDIGGQDSVKRSLRLAVAMATEPRETLEQLGIPPPKGFLLYGPPGCSKTMAAQAMATESGLNFFAVKGAELLNMYVGESERAVRRLFARAREVAPSMIFFDEIDAIAGQRSGFGHGGGGGGVAGAGGGGSGGGLNVLTTLLNEMDGFESLSHVIVLAATNRPQALDPALLRPGRFDDLVYVGPPDAAARRAILTGMAAGGRWARDGEGAVDVEALVQATDGCSGAETKAVCIAAGKAVLERLLQARLEGRTVPGVVTMADLEVAVRQQPRQITSDMVAGYVEWQRSIKKAA